ncbi:MAG: VWA domain-containing protein [Gammaproteobacteria bacterium]|nr:VWA domain-containing protein [Gammaproteobacteria bacterium]
MVVGPRYHPAPAREQTLSGTQSEFTRIHTETDATTDTHNPVRIHLLLDAGVSLSELKSSYHPVHINQTSENRYSISTIGENIVADRDFELIWKPELSAEPLLTAFKEDIDGDGDGDSYIMLTLLPPDLDYLQQKISARDVIFVLDVSGSMSGTSIIQAKASLITALDGLTSIDRFNIIWFNDRTGSLYPEALPATDNNKAIARHYINNLEASGGTEMLAALKSALSDQQEFSRLRQVIFLTDGNISNEDELFDVIYHELGNSRLFTIGIGSAPNSYFMRKAANLGRGTFTYIGDVDEVQTKTAQLFKKLETPALLNIQLNIDRDSYEVFPNIIPDLYAGETTSIFIRGKNLPENITIRGDYGNTEWQHSNELSSTSKDGIRTAWAREKISSLMSLRHESSADNERDAIEKEITSTALKHHLVSRYTSLVAVDVTPVNINEILHQQRMKNNLQHGWKRSVTSDGIMLAQTATSSKFNLSMSIILFIVAMIIYRLFYRRIDIF